MTTYPIILLGDPADAVWMAAVPDLRYCSAHGETAEEALRNVSSALDDILSDACERGLALPPPTTRPTLARVS